MSGSTQEHASGAGRPISELRALPRRIYIARHGRSVWNEQQRVSGQEDPPLSMRGICQAETLRGVLLQAPLDAVYCSNLQRSRETAVAVTESHRLPMNIAPALREQHYGALQGSPREFCAQNIRELRQQLQQNRVEFRPPGGESFLELEARLCAWLRATLPRHRDQSILIVGHRNTNRALFSLLLGWSHLKSIELPIASDWLHLLEPGRNMRLTSISLRESDLGTGYEGFQF